VTKKTIIILIVCILLIVIGIFSYQGMEYNLKKTQMDTLYTYFHKIQDSIKAKHYPINMDSLKIVVYNERSTVSIYSKLKVLEDSVKAYRTVN
jgi:hypothetical protein